MERGGHTYDVEGLAVSERLVDRPDGGQTRVVTFRGTPLRDGVVVPLDPRDATLHIVNPPEMVRDAVGLRLAPEQALLGALLDHIDAVADRG